MTAKCPQQLQILSLDWGQLLMFVLISHSQRMSVCKHHKKRHQRWQSLVLEKNQFCLPGSASHVWRAHFFCKMWGVAEKTAVHTCARAGQCWVLGLRRDRMSSRLNFESGGWSFYDVNHVDWHWQKQCAFCEISQETCSVRTWLTEPNWGWLDCRLQLLRPVFIRVK